jgi:hypothetical protein
MGEVGAVVGSVEDHCPHALFVRRRKTTETRASPPKGYGPGGLGCSKVAGSGLTRARKGRGNLGQGEEEQPREKRGFAVFFLKSFFYFKNCVVNDLKSKQINFEFETERRDRQNKIFRFIK